MTTSSLSSPNYNLLLLQEPIAQYGICTTFAIIFLLYMLQIIKTQIGSKKSVKKPFEDVPMLPNAHPLFGHLPSETASSILTETPSLSIDHLKQYSRRGLTSLWFLSHPFLIVIDPKAAVSLLHSYSFRELSPLVERHFVKNIGKKSLLAMNGKEWRLYRGAIHKAMTASFLKDYQRTMVECSYKLAESLKQKIRMKQHNKIVDVDDTTTAKQIHEDILPIMKMITADVFFQVSIGMDLQSCEKLETSKLLEILDVLSKDTLRRLFIHPLRPWNYFYFIPTIDNIKRYFLRLYVRKVVGDHVQKRRSEEKTNNKITAASSLNKKKKRNDMLTNILNVEGFNLSNDDILSVVFTLLHAGFETTSNALVYVLYMISTRPDIEKDLIEEIQNVLTTIDGKDEMDFDVSKLVLCRAVINETLRIYPIAYVVGRSIAKDDTMEINGLKFHGPALARISIWAIHRDENNFPCPEEFLPERWVRRTTSNEWVERFPGDDCKEEMEWASKHTIPPANRGAFLAFSSGSRDCVGKKFAYQEATIILAVLLKELKFEAQEDYVPVPVKTGFLQGPRDGMPMHISERK